MAEEEVLGAKYDSDQEVYPSSKFPILKAYTAFKEGRP